MRKWPSLLALLGAILLVSPAAQGAPCAGFTDVDDTSPFCVNVEWIRNRGITAGCTSSTLYCPTDSVNRLSLAVFLNRLGDSLFPLTCAAGQVMKWDGLQWTCANDAIGGGGGGGTVTSVAAGTGLQGSPNPITGAGAINLAPAYQLPQACSNGQVPKSNGAGGMGVRHRHGRRRHGDQRHRRNRAHRRHHHRERHHRRQHHGDPGARHRHLCGGIEHPDDQRRRHGGVRDRRHGRWRRCRRVRQRRQHLRDRSGRTGHPRCRAAANLRARIGGNAIRAGRRAVSRFAPDRGWRRAELCDRRRRDGCRRRAWRQRLRRQSHRQPDRELRQHGQWTLRDRRRRPSQQRRCDQYDQRRRKQRGLRRRIDRRWRVSKPRRGIAGDGRRRTSERCGAGLRRHRRRRGEQCGLLRPRRRRVPERRERPVFGHRRR